MAEHLDDSVRELADAQVAGGPFSRVKMQGFSLLAPMTMLISSDLEWCGIALGRTLPIILDLQASATFGP
ncbi:MAG TPA: hypothetical protein VEY92_01940 [Pseudoxanthomonas sp.]|nr:hypothetical protein [Pseudoxanthomonas sp.]